MTGPRGLHHGSARIWTGALDFAAQERQNRRNMEEEGGLRKIEDIKARAQRMIRKHGWMVQAVLGDESQPAMSYTVGLSRNFGHPEIFMIGFSAEMCHAILNIAAGQVKAGIRFDRPLIRDGVIERYPVAIRPLARESVVSNAQAGRAYLGSDFEGVQLFLPDADGRFPWDEDCDLRYARIQTSLLQLAGDDIEPGSDLKH